MNNVCLAACLGALALCSEASLAGAAMSAAEAARRAVQDNPDLRAARLVVDEAEGRARTVGRLANPELEVEVAGGQDFEGRVEIGFSQRFPLTARLRLERELSRIEIDSARIEIAQKERAVAAAARTAWIDLAAADAVLAAAKRHLESAEDFASTLRQLAAEGAATSLDEGEAGLVAAEARARVEELSADRALAAGALAMAIGSPADTPIRLRGGLALPARLPTAAPSADRPDIRHAELLAASGRLDVALARASRWDDIGVGAFVEGERFRDEPEGIEAEGLVGVRVMVPLPLWQNGSGRIAEKDASAHRRDLELAALRLRARNESALARKLMEIRHRAAHTAESGVLAAARQQSADADSLYRRGEADLQAVFRARQRMLDAETAVISARRAYFLAATDWLVASGANLLEP